MKRLHKLGVKIFIVLSIFLSINSNLMADSCSTKLFSVTIDSKLSIGDVIDNLAETCGLSVILKDSGAKRRLNKKLYYVNLKNSTLKGFLNIILKDNDLSYTLKGNKLVISYLLTRTFRIHYISGGRSGKSTANVTIASSSNSASGSSGGTSAQTGISIESSNKFKFWKTIGKEIQRILMGAKSASGSIGPDGKVRSYNSLAPIVDPEAGMVTVTGTRRQINRVSHYIYTLTKQLKSQVLIDVRILSVSFNKNKTTGIDWSQLYSLENFTIKTLSSAQKDISSYSFFPDNSNKHTDRTLTKSGLVNITSTTSVSGVVKFLSTQGDVKSISSPRVMTLNNQPALISVGKELFYKIKSSSVTSSGGGSTSAQGESVSSVFAGILLDITPEINSNGMITLKINPSISEAVDPTTAGATARTIPPDLVKRQIASVIKVKDGEHAILGGLISSKSSIKDNRIPVLGSIPLFGGLFRHREKINTIEELVLIITPHIVKNSKSLSLKDLGYSKINEK